MLSSDGVVSMFWMICDITLRIVFLKIEKIYGGDMKVKEMIELLQKVNPDSEIQITYCYTEAYNDKGHRHVLTMVDDVIDNIKTYRNNGTDIILIGSSSIGDKVIYNTKSGILI